MAGISAPERGDRAGFEALAELVDALGGVGALPVYIEAAEHIPLKTATHTTGAGKEVQNVKAR